MTHATSILLATAALAAAVPILASARTPELPEVERIQGDPVVTVLPPDRIPSIDDPRFVPASRAEFMQEEAQFHPGTELVRSGF